MRRRKGSLNSERHATAVDPRQRLPRNLSKPRTLLFLRSTLVGGLTLLALVLWRSSFSSTQAISLLDLSLRPLREIRRDYHPRYIALNNTDVNTSLVTSLSAIQLDPSMSLVHKRHQPTFLTKDELQRQFSLRKSEDYRSLEPPFETRECKAQYSWQLTSHPTCNLLHEVDLLTLSLNNKGAIVGKGYFRDVWGAGTTVLGNVTTRAALKTTRFEHILEPRMIHKHARDAMITERLTRSKLAIDIYGYCGSSSLNEYADGGDMDDAIWWHPSVQKKDSGRKPDSRIMLELATQASMGLADAHNIDKEGVASFAHTDIDAGQYVKIGKLYKLNDFNRARFVAWNITTNSTTCGYRVGQNGGKNRSPEEFMLKLQSEKVDVYALGSLFYHILTGHEIFKNTPQGEAQELVKQGLRPKLGDDVQHSTDINIVAIKEAMRMCFLQDPVERPTARQVEAHLVQALLRTNPHALKEWGLPPPPSLRS